MSAFHITYGYHLIQARAIYADMDVRLVEGPKRSRGLELLVWEVGKVIWQWQVVALHLLVLSFQICVRAAAAVCLCDDMPCLKVSRTSNRDWLIASAEGWQIRGEACDPSRSCRLERQIRSRLDDLVNQVLKNDICQHFFVMPFPDYIYSSQFQQHFVFSVK